MATSNEITQADIRNTTPLHIMVDRNVSTKVLSESCAPTSTKTNKRPKTLKRNSPTTTLALSNAADNRMPISDTPTDLPLEILTMISTCLFEDVLESGPKAPECRQNSAHIADQVTFDLRVRDMSFFAALQVNQSMRSACRLAFSHRLNPSVNHAAIAMMNRRIRLEERCVRRFDKLQQRVVAQEEIRATRSAGEKDSRMAQITQRQALAEQRIAKAEELQNEAVTRTEKIKAAREALIDWHTEAYREQFTSMLALARVDRSLRQGFLSYKMAIQNFERREQQWDAAGPERRFWLL